MRGLNEWLYVTKDGDFPKFCRSDAFSMQDSLPTLMKSVGLQSSLRGTAHG